MPNGATMTLPFDMGLGAVAYMAVAFLIAAFVRGYSGFGFSALVIAASSLVTSPLNFVAVVMFCEFLMTFQQWAMVARHVDWRRVTLLMVGAGVGVPLGLWLLTGLGVDAARAVISGYVLVMCFALMAGWTLKRRVGDRSHFVAGIISGVANAAGMGGLPVATFFAAQGVSAAVFRGTLIAYFALLDIWSAPLMWWHGMVSLDTLIAAALSLPIIGVGIWAGGRHFLNTDPQDFRRFSIILLAGLAVMGLLKSVL